MAILKYIGKRLLTLIPVLFGITVIAFILGACTPGDPVEDILNRDGDQIVTEEQREKLRERLGLDDPKPVQYVKWLRNAVTGELGQSFFTNKSIQEEMARRLPVTLRLACLGLLFTVVFGISGGILMAVFKDRWPDKILGSLATFFLSVPGFWLAIILIFIFAEKLKWLPTSGYTGLSSLILPGITVAASTIGVCGRLTRTAVLDEIGKQYILVANAKGMAARTAAIRHGFVNSMIPITTYIGNYFAGILGGSSVAEVIFGIPGIGSYAIDAVSSKDYLVVQAYVVFTGFVYVIMNLAIDLIYILINPKIRVGEKAR